MPQIWMTYDEIADLLGCDAEIARAMAIHRSLDRRKSRDGLTRTKLDLDWTERFIAAIREADPALDRAVRELRMMEDAMSRSGSAVRSSQDVARWRCRSQRRWLAAALQLLPIGPEERMRSVKSPDRDLMRDDPAEPLVRKPDVKVESWWLDVE